MRGKVPREDMGGRGGLGVGLASTIGKDGKGKENPMGRVRV